MLCSSQSAGFDLYSALDTQIMSSGFKFFLRYSHLNRIPQTLAQVTGQKKKKCSHCQNKGRSHEWVLSEVMTVSLLVLLKWRKRKGMCTRADAKKMRLFLSACALHFFTADIDVWELIPASWQPVAACEPMKDLAVKYLSLSFVSHVPWYNSDAHICWRSQRKKKDNENLQRLVI